LNFLIQYFTTTRHETSTVTSKHFTWCKMTKKNVYKCVLSLMKMIRLHFPSPLQLCTNPSIYKSIHPSVHPVRFNICWPGCRSCVVHQSRGSL